VLCCPGSWCLRWLVLVPVFALMLPFADLFISVAEERKSRSLREEFSAHIRLVLVMVLVLDLGVV
jgi:hypothetical protein